jgi:hypothetical protein
VAGADRLQPHSTTAARGSAGAPPAAVRPVCVASELLLRCQDGGKFCTSGLEGGNPSVRPPPWFSSHGREQVFPALLMPSPDNPGQRETLAAGLRTDFLHRGWMRTMLARGAISWRSACELTS